MAMANRYGSKSEGKVPEFNALPHILLVDDDEQFLDLIKTGLMKKFRVSTAQNGEEALHLFTKEHPDLVITDICMPKMSGFQLIRALSSFHVPILAVSGYDIIQSNYSGEASIIESAVCEVIRKPCAVADVCQAAERLVAADRLGTSLSPQNLSLRPAGKL